ncbi:nuclease SbcCD subunit C [Actinoplanes capillaceus]|uniref:Nuclease SbcCD subunit C n=1 Tax=Actinoplanes campanulatus TaxID=113559 RepID=A0ABQ3WS59_9ACTN|nr:SMC family ATPase [Actinoplanes capillaceus]GID49132.1 nuclease SbcCD subunit C [Actinoplanes capillaceus]
MRPLELTFSGLRSYRGRQHIDFRGQSLVGITGDTGAGKSSIFIAINFALFGACTFEAATPKVLIADGGDGVLAVELVFEARGKEWKVSRRLSKTSTNSHHRLEALDGSEALVGRAATTRIQQLIGLDQKTFVRSVLLRQGKFEELLHASPAERTRMLKGLLGLDILDTIAQQARDRRDAIIPRLHTLNERKAALFADPQAAAAQADIEIGLADERITKLKTAQNRLADLDKQRTDAEHERDQVLELADALAVVLDTDAPEQLEKLAADEVALATEDRTLAAELAPLREQRHGLLDRLGDRRPGGPLADVPATAATTLGQLREVIGQEAEANDRHAVAVAERDTVQDEATRIEAEASDLTTRRLTLEQQHKDTEAAEADLQKRIDAWRTDLRTARELTGDLTRLGQELETQQKDHAAAAATLEQHRATADLADQAIAAAEEILEVQKRLNAAAYAATDLGPGDACRICQHELPGDFVPPHAPALHTAEQDLKTARTQAKRAANLVTGALSRERETHTLAKQTATRLAETSTQAQNALSALTAQLGPIGLDRLDDQILHTPLEALGDAQRQTAAKADDLDKARSRAAAATATAKAINKDIGSRTRQIAQHAEHLGVLRERITGLIQELPTEYRPQQPTLDQVDHLSNQAAADRLQLGKQWNTLTQLGAAIDNLEARRAQLATNRADHITAPAQQHQQHMLEITAAYTLLTAVLHSPPASTLDLTADLATQAHWATATKDLALQAVQAGRARAAAIAPLIERIAGQAADITSNTPTDGKPIETACDDAVGRRAVAVKTRDTALTQIPIMNNLQHRIAAVQPHLDALNVLVELLGNGKFGTAVVQERQQNLLGSATTIIRGMTLGRFAFGPDFQIYDSHTGSVRDVKTLSGGETFQASLALALAVVVEQASSSGGRTESLFLDEGFGSLDHNALTYALDALSTQVTAGRLVVVISHMLAVAQHVPALLRVSKNAAGSTVRWATDTELHELADDLETGSLHI